MFQHLAVENEGFLFPRSVRERRQLKLSNGPWEKWLLHFTIKCIAFMEDKRWSESPADPPISRRDEFALLLQGSFCVYDWVWAGGQVMCRVLVSCVTAVNMFSYAICPQLLSLASYACLSPPFTNQHSEARWSGALSNYPPSRTLPSEAH